VILFSFTPKASTAGEPKQGHENSEKVSIPKEQRKQREIIFLF
jgi:hypothetical protein